MRNDVLRQSDDAKSFSPATDFSGILRESETLIAEFQKLFLESERKMYLISVFLGRKRKADSYVKFKDFDGRFGEMLSRFESLRTAVGRSPFPSLIKTYEEKYGNYLRSVKFASGLRVEFEHKLVKLNLSTSTVDDLARIKKLMVMISSGLDDCERNAREVNTVVQSFRGLRELENTNIP